MSSSRIQVVLDPAEREAFRAQARRERLSLSAWMKAAARDRLAAAQEVPFPFDAAGLDAFFADCDARRTGHELDWEDAKQLVAEGLASGRSET